MDELRRITKEYYQNTVSYRFFGIKGFLYIMLSLPFVYFIYKANFVWHTDILTIFFMCICGWAWLKARKQYDINLVIHLAYFTHLETNELPKHKALYLKLLTSHVSNSLHKTMGIFKGVIETHHSNKSFVIENFGFHFSNFIYNSEAKNRILSLVIYFISFAVLLIIIKSDVQFNAFYFISQLSLDVVFGFLGAITFLLLLGYLLIVFPCMFLISYLIVPMMLKSSSINVLNSFFISELNKYSYSESVTPNL